MANTNDPSQRETMFVHVVLKDGSSILAGQFARSAVHRKSLFKYSKAYLNHPEAYSFDPINLPLTDQTFEQEYYRDKTGIPGALLDGGPDGWGRHILTLFRDPPPVSDIDFLIAGSGTGVGTLRFTKTANEVPEAFVPAPPFQDLNEICAVAGMMDSKAPIRKEQRRYFEPAASIGGARPKTVIEHKGADWLVKFPRRYEAYDNPLAEHVTMQMAREAGINAAETEIVNTEYGNVLLVKRFDRGDFGQAHMVSMMSISGVTSIREANNENMSYVAIAKNLESMCTESGSSLEVFRRVVFNVATGNTDDHMRNHAVLRYPDGRWAMSPAYDLVPNPELVGAHAIAIGPMGPRASKDNIIACAKMLGVDAKQASEILEQVMAVTANYRERLAAGGMAESGINVLSKPIDYGRGVVESARVALTMAAGLGNVGSREKKMNAGLGQ